MAAKFATSGRFSPIEVTLATQRMLLIGRSEALVLEAAELRVVGEALHPSASVSIGIGDVVWVHGGHRERGPLPTWAIVHPKSYRSSDIDWLLGTNEDPITLGVEPEVVDRVSTNNDCLRPSGASDRTDLCETRTSGAKRATFAEAWAALEDLDIQPVTSNVFEEILHVAFAVVGVAFISSYLLSATMPIVALHVGLTALTIAAAIHLIGLRSRFQRRSIERESPWTIASVKEPDLPAILARMDRGPNRHFGCEVTYLAQPMICTRETETIAITDWSNIVLIPTRAPARTLRIDVGDRIWIRGGQRKRRPDPEWLGTSAHAQQSVPHVLSPPTDGALRLRTTVKLVPRADGP
ncbi:MAG: hypothetical protein R3B72_37715 [Polyangiaceae bacterium]